MPCELHSELIKQQDEQRQRIESLADRVTALEKESARYDEKIDRIFADIDAIKALLSKIELRIEELASKPSKRWEQVVSVLISGGVGAFVAWIISRGV